MNPQLINVKASLVSAQHIEYKTEKIENLPDDAVLVKVAYCGICGSDLPRFFEGKVHNYPLVLGHEFSGKVVKVGKSVRTLQRDDHVIGLPLKPCFNCGPCGNGLYAQCENYSFVGSREEGALQKYLLIDQHNLYKIENSIPLDEAAFIEPIAVAIHAFNLIKPSSLDSKILIYGLGNIGLILIQYLKWKGYKNITAVNRSQKKLEIAKKIGVVECFLEHDFNEYKDKEYSHIFDCTPASKSLNMLIRHCAPRGCINIVGSKLEEIRLNSQDFNLIQRKEIAITGSWMSYSQPFPGVEWEEAGQALKNGAVKVGEVIGKSIFAFSDIENAFQSALKTNVKSLIKVDDEISC